jgi:hypothetical protein
MADVGDTRDKWKRKIPRLLAFLQLGLAGGVIAFAVWFLRHP